MSGERDSVAQLVSRAVEGDQEAYAALSQRYRRRLRRYFATLDAADAAVRETLTRTLAALGSRRDRRVFEQWLAAIAGHVRAGSLPAAAPSTALRREVAALPDPLRVPLTLRHRNRLDYTEIAARLGISTDEVALRLFRARRRLELRLRGRTS